MQKTKLKLLPVPENVNLIMGGFDGENITAHLHIAPHALIILPGSEGKIIALAAFLKETGGAMTDHKTDINLTGNEGKKRLDISINVSRNRPLSRQRVIRLVKLLARQARKKITDNQSFIRSQGGEPYENARQHLRPLFK